MTVLSFDIAFRVLFEERFIPVYQYLCRLSGDPALAADIAQETFIKLYRRGEMPRDVRAWLLTVANNRFRDERRRADRQLRLLSRRSPEHLMSDASPAPDETLLHAEQQVAVRAALQALPLRDRQLLLLRHAGYSYHEIAVALGVTESSIGTLLARAKAAFRAVFERRPNAPA